MENELAIFDEENGVISVRHDYYDNLSELIKQGIINPGDYEVAILSRGFDYSPDLVFKSKAKDVKYKKVCINFAPIGTSHRVEENDHWAPDIIYHAPTTFSYLELMGFRIPEGRKDFLSSEEIYVNKTEGTYKVNYYRGGLMTWSTRYGSGYSDY